MSGGERSGGRALWLALLVLTGLAALMLQLTLPSGLGPSLARWPPLSGYLLSLLLLGLAYALPAMARHRRIRGSARMQHQETLDALGDTQIDLRELAPNARATLRARLVRADAPQADRSGGEPRLIMRGSQATSWSTHLPPQLSLQVASRRMAVRGVATLQAGSHERWLEYAPETRQPKTAPARAMVVIERALGTGDEVLIRGLVREAGSGGHGQDEDDPRLVMHGDHREPIELASLRVPFVSLSRRLPGAARPIRKALLALGYLLSVYAATRYHRAAAHCTPRQCRATVPCEVRLSAGPALFRCAAE